MRIGRRINAFEGGKNGDASESFAQDIHAARARMAAVGGVAGAVFERALSIALHDDVTTPRDRLVLFSVTGLPTPENRTRADAFITQNPAYMALAQTPAGQGIEKLALFEVAGMDRTSAYLPWFVVSSRLVAAASGNLTAFVDNAHPTSTFRRIEIPMLLRNPAIETLNGRDKWAVQSLATDHHDWYQTAPTLKQQLNITGQAAGLKRGL